MIRHDLKIMFVHINKTGGSSIVRALNMLQVHLSVELIFSENIDKDEQYKIWQGWEQGKRRTTYNWESLENIKNFWDDYQTFTVVRNPWDRIVSDFFYCIKEGYIPQDSSFRDEVVYNKDNKERWKQPCYDWLTLNGELKVDNILRFENLASDFTQMCEQLNLPKGINLPHLNKTKHKHYSEYYDDEMKEIVAEKYANDIKHFNYEFGK